MDLLSVGLYLIYAFFMYLSGVFERKRITIYVVTLPPQTTQNKAKGESWKEFTHTHAHTHLYAETILFLQPHGNRLIAEN